MAKAPRIRKAPSVRDVVQTKNEQTEPKKYKLGAAKGKLPSANIFGFLRPIFRPLRWLVPTYFANAWREVRQVSWPTRRETWRLTLAVFIFAVVFGLLVAGVDKVLDLIFKKVILKV